MTRLLPICVHMLETSCAMIRFSASEIEAGSCQNLNFKVHITDQGQQGSRNIDVSMDEGKVPIPVLAVGIAKAANLIHTRTAMN